ncbi:PilT protein domain protein [[Synechococcus] sp. NIES-970]|nr:PilT protein domain protein [[Synechococcus] sp. NIES-970]
MKYLLDTNVCIVYLKGNNKLLRIKLESHEPSELIVCSVVRFELFYGAIKSQKKVENIKQQQLFLKNFSSLFFDDQAAQYCGEIRAHLEKQGLPIGAYDQQIAAITLAHDLTLITHNVREFSRIPNLKIEDWEVSS